MIYVEELVNGSLRIEVEKESIPEFKELVHRATNLWPDASPDVKKFADVITIGKPMQDYSSPAVTAQPKFCTEIGTHCRSGCKHARCKIRDSDPNKNQY